MQLETLDSGLYKTLFKCFLLSEEKNCTFAVSAQNFIKTAKNALCIHQRSRTGGICAVHSVNPVMPVLTKMITPYSILYLRKLSNFQKHHPKIRKSVWLPVGIDKNFKTQFRSTLKC